MAGSVSHPPATAHRVLPETAGSMVKAGLRIPEISDLRAQIGEAVEEATRRWSLKELSDLLKRDERQLQRWMNGKERPQFDVLFAVDEIRVPLVIALAGLAGQRVEVETVIRVRRIA